jgi:hypothetical protein
MLISKKLLRSEEIYSGGQSGKEDENEEKKSDKESIEELVSEHEIATEST